jgi:thioredoxin-like negative regulator of GroEL
MPELSENFKVRSVPTLVLLKNGEQINTLVGSSTAKSVNDWIDQIINT